MSVKARLKKWRYMQAAGVPVICGICDEPISKEGDKGKGPLTTDHIIPRALGGGNENSNLQPAHKICNHRRSHYLLEEFKEALKNQEILRYAIQIIDERNKEHTVSASELVTYQPLVDALKQPLPEKMEDREHLREMVAFAESYGIVVSEHRRKLLVAVERQTAVALQQLKDGYELNEDNELVQSEESAAKFAKFNADEKRILLASEVAGISAELEFVTNLENLIKRRCSLGQTISNSFNTETQSSYNN